MFKKIIISIILIGAIFLWENIFSAPPAVNCFWLPWCGDPNIETPLSPSNYDKPSWKISTWISNLVSNIIKYVAVVAVISLMIAWLMYLLSWWEEEKLNKAKKMVIWSLVWVLLSVSAWMIINIINEAKIAL